MPSPFYSDELTQIWQDDIIATRSIAAGSVDLIVTSPPYNVDIAYLDHNDRGSYESYMAFTDAWLRRCFELTRADGRLCLNVPLDKNKGGQQSVYSDITSLAKSMGWQYHSTIVWNEQNISRRTAWGSWMSASAPFVIAPVEMIVVLYKERWKKTSGSRTSDVTRDEFMEWTNGVWTFNGESKKRVGHPAPFPLELPRRCIKLFSYVGDTVLDPFMGSGSTLVMATRLQRRAIGVDVCADYCALAVERLRNENGSVPPRARPARASAARVAAREPLARS
jgi:site-specific DNA-methyltransferase (adenine-specific)